MSRATHGHQRGKNITSKSRATKSITISSGQKLQDGITLMISGKPSVKKTSPTISWRGRRRIPVLLPNKSYTAALLTQKPQLELQAKGVEDALPLGGKDTKLHIKFEFGFRNFANEPDLDNLISSALDILAVAGIIANDRWVYSLDGSIKIMNCNKEFTKITIKEFEMPVIQELLMEEMEIWILRWKKYTSFPSA